MSVQSPAPRHLTFEGREVPLELRVSSRARRLSLRLDPGRGGLVLTLPEGLPVERGLDFIDRQSGWIAGRLAQLPPHVPFAEGGLVPILGVEHQIRHAPWARGAVWPDSGLLWVAGAAEHLSRRVTDYLKAEARRQVARRSREKAALLPRLAPGSRIRPLGRIAVRETSSRWGSCTARGDLSYCWRLVLAPEAVLDYVVAHEVAHLVHLDHSPAFWRLCDRLADQCQDSRAWLRRHGARLQRYG
ncbi:MAG: M48 family metallopeptidase [Tistlia sp.]|uniref:M48 family metallopeptidase n=1 Tax=Tistlia sp. TaxID=3057121 RepID=UPI0034A4187B